MSDEPFAKSKGEVYSSNDQLMIYMCARQIWAKIGRVIFIGGP
jgi:hypothetical protein